VALLRHDPNSFIGVSVAAAANAAEELSFEAASALVAGATLGAFICSLSASALAVFGIEYAHQTQVRRTVLQEECFVGQLHFLCDLHISISY
jgi:hypothetical protein